MKRISQIILNGPKTSGTIKQRVLRSAPRPTMLDQRHTEVAATVTLKPHVLSRSPVTALWDLF